MNTATANAISVQIITPRLGWTRKLPPEATTDVSASSTRLPGEEERDQAEDERVEDDRLGEREAQPLDRGDVVAHLGLAGDGPDHLPEDVGDADAGADRPEPGAAAEREALGRAAPPLGEDDSKYRTHVVPPGLVLADCAAEIDGS